MIKRNNVFIFITGMIIGLLLSGSAFFVLLKAYRKIKSPKRFETFRIIQELESSTVRQDLRIFTASSLDRVFLDGKTLVKPTFSGSIGISVARNEYESAQLVLQHLTKDLSKVILTISDLVNPKTGQVFSGQNFSWRKVGYVPTGEPYYPVKYIGMWPDPLLPVKDFELRKQEFQSIWLTVFVPEDVPAGEYQGHIEVIADGMEQRQISLSLKVYDFTLPAESQLKTAFDFYGHITKLRYPQGERESDLAWSARIDDINEKFIVEMLKYRMNPVLNIDPTSPAELGRVDRYRRFGINNFAIGRRGGTFNNNWPTDQESINKMSGLYRTYAELLKLNGMLQYTYIYSWDEGEIGNQVVAWVTGMIRQAHPGLKNMVCYHGFWDPDQHPGWGKDIDIWTFNIDDFRENALRKLQKLGIEIWMYVSGPAGIGAPNLVIDADPVEYRILPWLCWKYDIKGFLYWCVNWWKESDPFISAVNTHWAQNGNGLLFYPGENGPIASIRTELFRDGMEDYEYIQLLMKKIKEIKILKLENRFAKEIASSINILTVDGTIAESMFKFTKDGEILRSRRDQIAETIEKFNRMIVESRSALSKSDPK